MDDGEQGAALCAPFLAQLPVEGMWITVVSASGAQSTVSTSDAIAGRLEELQFRLGEGPTADVLRTRLPVIVPDLAAPRVQRDWPVFAPAAEGTGARAIFSLPMFVGMLTVGVVSLYALTSRPPWSDAVVQSALRLAAGAAAPAMDLATRSAIAERRPGRPQPELRRQVHQAAGMVMVQLDSTIDEAMSRLRAYAFAEDLALDAVARSVVAGTLDLSGVDD